MANCESNWGKTCELPELATELKLCSSRPVLAAELKLCSSRPVLAAELKLCSSRPVLAAERCAALGQC